MIRFFVLALPMIAISACIQVTNVVPPEGPRFKLVASVDEALEGGPLAIRATLIYQGPEPISVYYYYRASNVFATVPDEWRPARLRIRGSVGPGYGIRNLKPGDSLSETICVHHSYTAIKSGKAVVDLSWSVYVLKGTEKIPLATPSTRLTVDIPVATKERLDALAFKLMNKLNDSNCTKEDLITLADLIEWSGHQEFIPVALRLLVHHKGNFLESSLLHFVSSCGLSPEEVHVILARFASTHSTTAALAILGNWFSEYPEIASSTFQLLLDSDNPWVRILTYVTFPDRCPARWRESLLKDIAGLQRAGAGMTIQQLIRDLDNDGFTVREKATAELGRLGEFAEPDLRRALRGPISPEARLRVERLLEQVERGLKQSDWLRALATLENWNTLECQEVLGALSKGDADRSLTRLAKEAMGRMPKPHTRVKPTKPADFGPPIIPEELKELLEFYQPATRPPTRPANVGPSIIPDKVKTGP